jgi:hypothetical protein
MILRLLDLLINQIILRRQMLLLLLECLDNREHLENSLKQDLQDKLVLLEHVVRDPERKRKVTRKSGHL